MMVAPAVHDNKNADSTDNTLTGGEGECGRDEVEEGDTGIEDCVCR